MRVLLLLLLACQDPGGKRESGDTRAPDSRESAPPDSGESGPPDSSADSLGDDTGCICYADRDGDGHGDPGQPTPCDDPLGAACDDLDCDDAHMRVYGGAPELATSGRDDDCDGLGGGAGVRELPSWMAAEGAVVPYPCGFGVSVAEPGDLDGDGRGDLVVGLSACVDDNDAVYTSAQLFLGPLSALSESRDMRSAESSLQEDANHFVESMAAAGDVDGDGFRDLLVGISSGSAESATYLVRGPVPAGVIDLDAFAQRWYAPGNTYLYGSVGPGDVDGDGLDDVVLRDFGVNDFEGEVYLFLGPAMQTSTDEADAVFYGEWYYDCVGSSLTAPGDLDGDGLGDFAFTSANSSESHLVLDVPSAAIPAGEAGVTVVQDASGDRHQDMRVCEVGDVNGDGATDIGFAEWSNSAFLILFGPFGDADEIDLATEWGAALISSSGGVAEPQLVLSTPLGDWDGDGHEDLALANRWFVPEELRSDWRDEWDVPPGTVFLLAGPVTGGVVDLEVSADQIGGEWFTTQYPTSLAGGSDLDADGFPDLAIGDANADAAYVLFGGGAI